MEALLQPYVNKRKTMKIGSESKGSFGSWVCKKILEREEKDKRKGERVCGGGGEERREREGHHKEKTMQT